VLRLLLLQRALLLGQALSGGTVSLLLGGQAFDRGTVSSLLGG